MSKHIRYDLCALYLGLGPVVWFSSIVLGPVKRLLLLIIVLLFFSFFIKKNVRGFRLFVLLSVFLSISLLVNHNVNDEGWLNVVLGVVEEFIFFIIGYNLARQNFFNRNSSFVVILLACPFILALLTEVNFITGMPGWIAPGQLDRFAEKSHLGYEIEPLWATGFSWGRNGWGCTLCLLLPFCFLLRSKSLMYICWIVIFMSIMICGNRNGMLAGVSSLIIHLFFSNIVKKRYSLFVIVGMCSLFMILLTISGNMDVMSVLRLSDSDDISSGRIFQYLLIPKMISEMGFWGLGHGGTAKFLYSHGLGDHALHMTYFKILIEYGWLFASCLFIIVIHSIKLILKSIRSQNTVVLAMSLVMFSGLLVALFEPEAVFASLGGYAIWWFSYGYLLSIYDYKHNCTLENQPDAI